MEERLRRVIKCGCSLRSKPVVAAQLGPVSQVRDTASLRVVCSHSALNLRESVFVPLQRVNVWTTKEGWKFCSAFSESKLLLRCSEPGRAVTTCRRRLDEEQRASGACKTNQSVHSKRVSICGLTVA